MKKLKMLLVAAGALALAACGDVVEVPPASVGKIITQAGYQEGLRGTSKFRLDMCLRYCDKLAVLQIADRTTTEPLKLFMPKDKLEMDVAVRATLSINQTKADDLFNSIVPVETDNPVIVSIPWQNVYDTYARQIIQVTTREYLTQFTIAEVSSSIEEINSTLSALIQKELQAKTPFIVRSVGLTNIQYPPIITEAQENAARRREQIQQEEAQLQIRQVQLETELQEAKLQRHIEFERAQGEAAAQKIQREVVDARVLELRRLENERLWIEKWDGVLPVTSLMEAIPMATFSMDQK